LRELGCSAVPTLGQRSSCKQFERAGHCDAPGQHSYTAGQHGHTSRSDGHAARRNGNSADNAAEPEHNFAEYDNSWDDAGFGLRGHAHARQ
jgi:hypothetical protein